VRGSAGEGGLLAGANRDQLPDFGLLLNNAACGREVLCEALCDSRRFGVGAPVTAAGRGLRAGFAPPADAGFGPPEAARGTPLAGLLPVRGWPRF